jgi:hypothetical protein
VPHQANRLFFEFSPEGILRLMDFGIEVLFDLEFQVFDSMEYFQNHLKSF